MSKRSKLANTKKTGGSDLDHPGAVNSNGKIILTVRPVSLYACANACVRLRACVEPACLSVTHVVTLFLFINLSVCHHPLGSV